MRSSIATSYGQVGTWQPRPSHRVLATVDGGVPVPWTRHETEPADAVNAVAQHYEALRRLGAVRHVRVSCGDLLRRVGK